MVDEKKEKKPIQILRERHGGMSEQMKEYFKDLNQIRKTMTTALKQGPMTVPELASATGIPSQSVMWHLMAMRRYGAVADADRAGDYLKYALKEAE